MSYSGDECSVDFDLSNQVNRHSNKSHKLQSSEMLSSTPKLGDCGLRVCVGKAVAGSGPQGIGRVGGKQWGVLMLSLPCSRHSAVLLLLFANRGS